MAELQIATKQIRQTVTSSMRSGGVIYFITFIQVINGISALLGQMCTAGVFEKRLQNCARTT